MAISLHETLGKLTRFDRSRPLVFMRVPKTSGTALTAGLEAVLKPSITIGGFDRCLFGSFDNFETIDENVRQHINLTASSFPSMAELVAGHIALSTLREVYPHGQLITCLREPISRLLSQWLYWHQHTNADLASWGDWAHRIQNAKKPLASVLSEPLLACQTDNLTLRMLLWPHPLIPPDGFIDPANDETLLHAAVASLDVFDFVEIIENSAFLGSLQAWFGNQIPYDRTNETRSKTKDRYIPLHKELTVEAHDLLRLRSRLDRHLWNTIGARTLSRDKLEQLRDRTILVNVARHAALIATQAD